MISVTGVGIALTVQMSKQKREREPIYFTDKFGLHWYLDDTLPEDMIAAIVPFQHSPHGRDYALYNFCFGCELAYPKMVNRCIKCKQLLRTQTKWGKGKRSINRETKRI